MGTRCNWHVDIDLDADVPLPSPAATVQEVGRLVPLDPDIDLVGARNRLHGLNADERDLEGRGVTCDLKWQPNMTCAACPLRGQGHRAPLCTVGVQQEGALALMVVLEHGLTPGEDPDDDEDVVDRVKRMFDATELPSGVVT